MEANKKKISLIQTQIHVGIQSWHLALLWTFVSWPIIFLLFFVSQPAWLMDPVDGYLSGFPNTSGSGSGSVLKSGNSNLSNTLLSDKGRQTLLWVSFLFALLVGLFVYVFTRYY